MSASVDLHANRVGASFRDPSGFLFHHENVLYRQINQIYAENYTHLMTSGLYEALTSEGLLVAHLEVKVDSPEPERAYQIIQPEPLTFISYPYEWSFSQLKDAALTTLTIQKRALQYGMWLKDSSAYNVQFHQGRPLLIDTLSFERYPEGQPWVAYRQFCQHFLAPLSLMAYRDVRLSQLLRTNIDGIPLDLASKLLPWRTRASFPLLVHIHTHAASQRRYAARPVKVTRQVSRTSLLGLIDNLEAGIRGLKWSPAGTEWGDYYIEHNYTPRGLAHKKQLVEQYLSQIEPTSVWDCGANTGLFSRLASERGIPTIAFDIDPGAVEQNYLACRRDKETALLPLWMDFTNPSPGIGWHNRERPSLVARAPAEAVMALALVHHLAIANNVPLVQVAEFFATLGKYLIVEFVPKSDSQVQRLLATRADIFPDYNLPGFEAAFQHYFRIHQRETVVDSQRVLYLMERHSSGTPH